LRSPWTSSERLEAPYARAYFVSGGDIEMRIISGRDRPFDAGSTTPKYLQSTGFVLDPTGRVIVSVYSSGAIGRLAPDDVVGLVRYLHEEAAAA
jgi:hypothetical protein